MNTLKKKSWTRFCRQLKKLDIMGIRESNKGNLEKIIILLHNKLIVKGYSKNKISCQKIMAWNTNNRSVVKCIPRHFCYLKKETLFRNNLKLV